MVGKQNKYSFGAKRKILSPAKLAVTIIGLLIIGAGSFILIDRSSHKTVLPTVIDQSVSFVIFYPTDTTGVIVDRASFKFDKASGVLSYTAEYSGASLTIAEQSTPENFVDIPEAFTKLIQTLNEYSTFDSFHDTVHLTKPKELMGQQSAIMNSKGTLMFANVTKGALTDDQWKKLFNNLEVIR